MRIVQLSGSSAGGVGRHVRELGTLLAGGGRRPGTLPPPTPGDEVLVAGPPDVLAPLGEAPGCGPRSWTSPTVPGRAT